MTTFKQGDVATLTLDPDDTLIVSGDARLQITLGGRPQYETQNVGLLTYGPYPGTTPTVIVVNASGPGFYTQQSSDLLLDVKFNATSGNLITPVNGGAISLGGARTPGLYQVGTRCYDATGSVQGANFLWSQDFVMSTVPLPAGTVVRLGWGFWKIDGTNNENYLTGSTTFQACLVNPSGGFIFATEAPALGKSVTFDLGGSGPTGHRLEMNFTIPNYIPAYTPIPVRGLQDGAGVFWRQGQTPDQAAPGQGMLGPSNGTRPNITDAFTSFGEYSFPPVLFAVVTSNPSVCIFADSREETGTEGPRPPFYDYGLVSPAIATKCGYTNLGHSGTGLNQFLVGVNTERLALARKYFNIILRLPGINDLNAFSRTAAQFLADCATFAALFPNQIVIGGTIAPVVNTTDGFATLANQALSSVKAQVDLANEGIRAGVVGEKGILDVADAVDAFRLSKWPVDRNNALAARATSCQFTGSIAGSTLTMSALTSGSLNINDSLIDALNNLGTGTLSGCTVLQQLTGTAGGSAGATFRVSRPQTLTSRTLYVGGFGTYDGFHQTAPFSEQVKAKLIPQVAELIR